jgi:hypothetical protein
MIDKKLAYEVLIQEKLEKAKAKSKTEDNQEIKSSMRSDCRVMSATCTRYIFLANMRLRLDSMMCCECIRNGRVI